MSDTNQIRKILMETRTIATVGLSAKWHRPSYFAAKYMQHHGYRIVPVNPRYDEVLGCRCYASLDELPMPVDMVDCFRKPEDTPELARQAVAIGAKCLWLQLGVHNDEAQAIAAAGELDFISNRCVKIEHARLFGGLGFAGVNTGIISSRRPL